MPLLYYIVIRRRLSREPVTHNSLIFRRGCVLVLAISAINETKTDKKSTDYWTYKRRAPSVVLLHTSICCPIYHMGYFKAAQVRFHLKVRLIFSPNTTAAGTRECQRFWQMTYCTHTFSLNLSPNTQQCCCPRGKSLSSRILEDQFSSPCPCPRPRKFKSSKIFEDWVG